MSSKAKRNLYLNPTLGDDNRKPIAANLQPKTKRPVIFGIKRVARSLIQAALREGGRHANKAGRSTRRHPIRLEDLGSGNLLRSVRLRRQVGEDGMAEDNRKTDAGGIRAAGGQKQAETSSEGAMRAQRIMELFSNVREAIKRKREQAKR